MPFQKLAREEALGRFQLIARLGQGGMADVFLARLVGAGGFEKLVAIKRLLPTRSNDRGSVARFLKEGRIAAQLDHPNVCHVYELDEVDGTPFLAMEFLRGLPWSEVVPAIPDRPRPTIVRFVVGVIAQACAGLHHAHTMVGIDGQPRPIVHRDVSPTNLFVTNEGIVKLLDFGVSKVLTEASVTATGMVMGKVPYMSPEQMRNKDVDVRTDVFSLAIVTWEALAGRTLFDRASTYDTIMAVAEGNIPALPGDDRATQHLDMVLRRALACDRTYRHGSAREFADDLCRAIATCGAPMLAAEIEAHVLAWLGPSLLRNGRELAGLLGGWQHLEEMSGEQTSLYEPAPIAGARLRDVSVAVGKSALATRQTIKGIPAVRFGDMITAREHASITVTDAPDTARIALSRELTIPRFAGVDTTVDAPGLATTEPTRVPTRRREAVRGRATPNARPEPLPAAAAGPSPGSWQRALILLALAALAMVGVMLGRLLV